MSLPEGKYTLELFAKEMNLQRQSALNALTKLKKEGKISVSGGGRQKRIYTITNKPQIKTNGFYDIINKHSSEKLVPKFNHIVKGRYTIEHAIIDGIKIGDIRTLEATAHLFNQITNWKRLFHFAKEKNYQKEVCELYNKARKTMKCKTMPKKYCTK